MVIKENYPVLVSAFSTAQWMMVSHLIGTMQLFSKNLAKYFVQKIETIRRQLDTDQTDSNLGDNALSAVLVESVPSFPAFKDAFS